MKLLNDSNMENPWENSWQNLQALGRTFKAAPAFSRFISKRKGRAASACRCGIYDGFLQPGRRETSKRAGLSNRPPERPSLDGFAFLIALLQHLHVGLGVGVAGVLGQRLLELLARPRVVAAHHVGKALVVEDFHGGAGEPDGLAVGAVGQIVAAQAVVGCRKPEPR